MAWSNETYIIGEYVRVEGEKDPGVVTRIDVKRGLIYVMFKRLREETYPFPASIDNKSIAAIDEKLKKR